jgi:3-methyl-2-oxobutanoate hydroxymethyltransferase
MITAEVNIPTVGIGAGPRCDGQVLVINDILGTSDEFSPRFVKRYAEIGELMAKAVGEFIDDVRDGRFPDARHSYSADGAPAVEATDGSNDGSNDDSRDGSNDESSVDSDKPDAAKSS